jgi:hypothetical protein
VEQFQVDEADAIRGERQGRDVRILPPGSLAQCLERSLQSFVGGETQSLGSWAMKGDRTVDQFLPDAVRT